MRKKRSKTFTVTYRAVEDEFEELRKNGQLFDESPGKAARRLVRECLRGTKAGELEQRVTGLEAKLDEGQAAIRETLDWMIDMIKICFKAMLTHGGKLTPEQAEEWLKKCFGD